MELDLQNEKRTSGKKSKGRKFNAKNKEIIIYLIKVADGF